jgi:Putative zinc-finger
VTHLGDRVAAFVDGQLSPESAERTTAHLVTCRPCRDLVELERLTKARLSALCGPEPNVDLIGRLLAMGGPAGPLPPRPGYVPGSPRPQPVTMPTLQRDVPRPGRRREPVTSTRPGGRTGTTTTTTTTATTTGARPSRLAAAVFGALSVVGVGVAGVAAGSTAAASGPTPVPQRSGAVVDPASAGFVTVRIAPIEWTQGAISSRIPVDRAVARR